ncbi:SGNH/GDSL hydrolase family protein [Nesterenkonia lutea]|uniref:Lysophospholipase L1-like esterase n=1 Tax=Nesterenkonia lutea TaxID=272919 RepID=A0ABR9JFA2_9MICC|nr:SGNH/GDSL hydrolase family protein [Nesterenkonia lutea]MBE1524613.1 lysophospholipase L1-like esterase [Nesterenkonia lutea]
MSNNDEILNTPEVPGDTPEHRADAGDAPAVPRHPWTRYVALGDSFTEGIGDPDQTRPGYHRGWADRVAEELALGAAATDGARKFSYANLAVRGKLIAQIRDEQIAPALELRPDLITLCAGGNDVIRPGGDPDEIARVLDTMVQILSTTGATIVLFNGPDVRETPVVGSIRGKVAIFNENIRTIAARHDAVVADMWSLRELTRPEMWDADRLHFSALGHHTIARMVLETMNVKHDLVPSEPRPAPVRSWREARVGDVVWARHHLFPWVIRRLRGRSSGDGIHAKRPNFEPLFGGSMPPGGSPADD